MHQGGIVQVQDGDIAGLALLNLPDAWIGVAKEGHTKEVRQYDQQSQAVYKCALGGDRIWLRTPCNFDAEIAVFSYRLDGENFLDLGVVFTMVFQLRTFQGVRFVLFNYNVNGTEGGYADFNDFQVDEHRPLGLTRPIPYGKPIELISLADSTVLVNWKGCARPDRRGGACFAWKIVGE